MTTFKLNTGSGWVEAPQYAWNGAAWAKIGGGAAVPPPAAIYRQIASRTGVSTYTDQATSGGRTSFVRLDSTPARSAT